MARLCANQSSACSLSGVTYVHDTVAPAIAMITGSTPTPPSNSAMPAINGTAEAGATVELYTNNACSGAPTAMGVTNASGLFAITAAVSATTQFYTKAKDAAGNVSGCSPTAFTFTYDATPPAAPTTLVTIPASPSTTNNTPLVTGNAEAGSTVRIFRTADCTGTGTGELTGDRANDEG